MHVVRCSLLWTYENHTLCSQPGGRKFLDAFSNSFHPDVTLHPPLYVLLSDLYILSYLLPTHSLRCPGDPRSGPLRASSLLGLTSREWAWGLSRAKTTTTTCNNNKRHNLWIIWIPAGLPTYHCLHPTNRYTKRLSCEPSSAAGPLPTGFSAGLQRVVGGGWTSTWRSLRSER